MGVLRWLPAAFFSGILLLMCLLELGNVKVLAQSVTPEIGFNSGSGLDTSASHELLLYPSSTLDYETTSPSLEIPIVLPSGVHRTATIVKFPVPSSLFSGTSTTASNILGSTKVVSPIPVPPSTSTVLSYTSSITDSEATRTVSPTPVPPSTSAVFNRTPSTSNIVGTTRTVSPTPVPPSTSAVFNHTPSTSNTVESTTTLSPTPSTSAVFSRTPSTSNTVESTTAVNSTTPAETTSSLAVSSLTIPVTKTSAVFPTATTTHTSKLATRTVSSAGLGSGGSIPLQVTSSHRVMEPSSPVMPVPTSLLTHGMIETPTVRENDDTSDSGDDVPTVAVYGTVVAVMAVICTVLLAVLVCLCLWAYRRRCRDKFDLKEEKVGSGSTEAFVFRNKKFENTLRSSQFGLPAETTDTFGIGVFSSNDQQDSMVLSHPAASRSKGNYETNTLPHSYRLGCSAQPSQIGPDSNTFLPLKATMSLTALSSDETRGKPQPSSPQLGHSPKRQAVYDIPTITTTLMEPQSIKTTDTPRYVHTPQRAASVSAIHQQSTLDRGRHFAHKVEFEYLTKSATDLAYENQHANATKGDSVYDVPRAATKAAVEPVTNEGTNPSIVDVPSHYDIPRRALAAAKQKLLGSDKTTDETAAQTGVTEPDSKASSIYDVPRRVGEKPKPKPKPRPRVARRATVESRQTSQQQPSTSDQLPKEVASSIYDVPRQASTLPHKQPTTTESSENHYDVPRSILAALGTVGQSTPTPKPRQRRTKSSPAKTAAGISRLHDLPRQILAKAAKAQPLRSRQVGDDVTTTQQLVVPADETAADQDIEPDEHTYDLPPPELLSKLEQRKLSMKRRREVASGDDSSQVEITQTDSEKQGISSNEATSSTHSDKTDSMSARTGSRKGLPPPMKKKPPSLMYNTSPKRQESNKRL